MVHAVAAIGLFAFACNVEAVRLSTSQSSWARDSDHEDMKPLMSKDELEAFGRVLKETRNYFEYGAGGSTVFALSFPNIKLIHSSEPLAGWIGKLERRSDILSAEKAGRLKLVHMDIGKVKAWGYPDHQDTRSWVAAARRTLAPAVVNDHDAKWDTIFVDGRYRTSCVLNALSIADAQTRILLHDFPTKENRRAPTATGAQGRTVYANVLKFADIVSQTGTLAVLKAKPEFLSKETTMMQSWEDDMEKFADVEQ